MVLINISLSFKRYLDSEQPQKLGVMSPSGAKVRPVCLFPIIKHLDCLSVRFLSCHLKLLCVQLLFEPVLTCMGERGPWYKQEAYAVSD